MFPRDRAGRLFATLPVLVPGTCSHQFAVGRGESRSLHLAEVALLPLTQAISARKRRAATACSLKSSAESDCSVASASGAAAWTSCVSCASGMSLCRVWLQWNAHLRLPSRRAETFASRVSNAAAAEAEVDAWVARRFGGDCAKALAAIEAVPFTATALKRQAPNPERLSKTQAAKKKRGGSS